MPASQFLSLLEPLISVVDAAAAIVMDVYGTDFEYAGKNDKSPVTEADQRAEALIVPALQRLLPGIPVVAEEELSSGIVPTVEGRFWLVDPLDGTKEFISRRKEFTVNVALIEDGVPVLGVVQAPALGAVYVGALGHGAFLQNEDGRQPISCREPPVSGIVVVASRYHGDKVRLETFLATQNVAKVCTAGSSLKLCMLAEGKADAYPRFGRTMEWDTAAGHAVLLAAGGHLEEEAGTALLYGKANFENPAFIAWGAGLPSRYA